jgi:uncharacterized protein YigE (DUF2233 family)
MPWFWIMGLLLASTALAQPAQSAQLCRRVTYKGVSYSVCQVDIRQHQLRLFWQDSQGQAIGSFRRLNQVLPQKQTLLFAMNAGMYNDFLEPIGLYVENGKQLRRLVLSDGPGNFHLKPNGVFYIGKQVGVMESGRFVLSKIPVQFATQSGPMLVIDGKIHPRLEPDSNSFKVRNGVGVKDAYTAVFVLSDQPVNFYSFAQFFRDGLKCANALYLDGSISDLYSPDLRRTGNNLFAFGPMVAVVR